MLKKGKKGIIVREVAVPPLSGAMVRSECRPIREAGKADQSGFVYSRSMWGDL